MSGASPDEEYFGEHIAELEAELEQARKDYEEILNASGRLRGERDGYRDALERIYRDSHNAWEIARDALAGEGQT